MAVLTSTGITFGDATTQTTAATAAALVTTTNVLNATAAGSAGDVGTYAMLGRTSNGATTQGTTYSGSDLRFIALVAASSWGNLFPGNQWVGNQGTPSGTWRAIASSPDGAYCTTFGGGLFLRVS